MNSWLKNHCPFLFEEKIPVWLTVVFSIIAATVTYFVAPLYTRQFQIEDVRSTHLTSTTNNLNEEIINLSQKIRRFRTALASEKIDEAASLREECLDAIVKLQWRLVDLRVILKQPDDEIYVTELSNSLEKLRLALDAPVTDNYQSRIRLAMDELAKSTTRVLNRLYGKASLQG